MKACNLCPWLPLIAAAAVVAVALVAHQLRPQASDPRPPPEPPNAINHPNVPGWMQLAYIDMAVADAKDLHVVHPPASAFCYVVDASADPTKLDDFPPMEEYADCWRGVLLCAPDQPGLLDGPHAARAADFYLFGDVQLIDRVKPVVEGLSRGLRPGR